VPHAATVAAAVAVGLADISLTVMLVGAIALAGATVVMTAIPDVRWPFRRRPEPPEKAAVQSPAVQRRVITGRAAVLPPPGTPLPRQATVLPDGHRAASADVARAEAMIDHFLDTDPEMLAATMSAWIAQDDRKRTRRGRR
jgi:hypothetical protein